MTTIEKGKYIDAGRFTTCFQDPSSAEHVILHSNCPVKRLMAEGKFPEDVRIPQIIKIGENEYGQDVYRAEKYTVHKEYRRIKGWLSPYDKGILAALREVRPTVTLPSATAPDAEVWGIFSTQSVSPPQPVRTVPDAWLTSIWDAEALPRDIKHLITNMFEVCMRHNVSPSLDVCVQNFAVKDGQLIFLDIISGGVR